MSTAPISLHRLPARLFPLKIEAFRCGDRALIWAERVREPKTVTVPPLARMHGCLVEVRITYADGSVSEA